MSNNSMKSLFLKSLRKQRNITSLVTIIIAFAIITSIIISSVVEHANKQVNSKQQENLSSRNVVSSTSSNKNNSYEQKNNNTHLTGETSTTVADFLKQPTVESGDKSKIRQIKDIQKANDYAASDVRVEKAIDVVEDSKKSINKNSNKAITKVSSPRTYHTTGNLNMRKGPGKKYKIIKVVPKGKNVTYKGKKGTWYRVSYKGTTGYVSKSYLRSGAIKKVSNSLSGKTMYMTSTAYTAYCNGCSGKTAIGINLRKNPYKKVIAVDPRVIPLRKMVYVNGYGLAIAGDTGSAIKGRRIDLFMPSKKQAYNWGRRTVKVTIQK